MPFCVFLMLPTFNLLSLWHGTQSQVGSVDPVGDFEAMLSAGGSPDIVSTAMTQMMARIEELVMEGATTVYLLALVE